MSASPQPIPSLSQLQPLLAPVFLGTLFNWLLLGIVISQVYAYHIRYKSDRHALRAMVYSLFVIDLAQTGCTTHASYLIYVRRWGENEVIMSIPKTMVAISTAGVVISAVVQSFYIWRIWTLGKHLAMKIAAILIFLTAVASSTSCFVESGYFLTFTQTSQIQTLQKLSKAWLIGGAAADALIATCMITILYSCRTDLSFSIITCLIRRTVSTGAVTAVCAIIELTLMLVFPNNYLYLAFAWILSQLYYVSLLANLNARTYTPEDSQTQGTSATSFALRNRQRMSSGNRIHVDTTTTRFNENAIELEDNYSREAIGQFDHKTYPMKEGIIGA